MTRPSPMARHALRLVRHGLVGLWLLAGCSDEDYAALFSTQPIAPSFTREMVENLDTMGPTIIDQGINFSVYSEHAERMELLVFLDPESERPDQRLPMRRFGNVWNLYVEGLGRGTHYGYVAWGPNWTYDEDWYPGSILGFKADVDSEGNRFNPNKLLLDPWAKAVHRDHDWARASLGTGPDRTKSTWGAAAKSLVIKSEHQWSDEALAWVEARKKNEAPFRDWNGLIVYEVHLKGMTADAASGVLHPGTYRGLGEMADYFVDLGVNVVELLPIHEKPLDGGYWGYNNISFFAPEISYASGCEHSAWAETCDPLEIVDEFKWMVDELHKRGIEVWVDVVYNHTGEGGLWRERIYHDDTVFGGGSGEFYNLDPQEVASLYSFRGLDNASWYKLPPDGLTYWNNTGVGNQVRTNHTPGRRLILDSLEWMVEELHLDGFRFDLAPVLGEVDDQYNVFDSRNTILQEIADDPILLEHHTRIIAEPWSVCNGCGFQLGQFPPSNVMDGAGWGEWNAYFRDYWREFVNFDDRALNSRVNGDPAFSADLGFSLTGSYGLFGDDGRRPYHAVNFVTVHDGFTLYDLVTYEERNNGCSPLNPVCCDDPTSPWCEQDSGEEYNRSRNWGSDPAGEAMKRQMMRNFFAAMMIGHGTPMILGGDEWMRTQLGNNNAYSTQADNSFNWHEWGKYLQSRERNRMFDFVAHLTRVRMQNLHHFSPKEWEADRILQWKAADGSGNVNWGGRHVMIHYPDTTNGPEVVVLLNMERFPVTFQLPGGRNWERLIDTQRWFDFDDVNNDNDFFDQTGADKWKTHNASLEEPVAVTGSSYEAQDSSIVILRAAN